MTNCAGRKQALEEARDRFSDLYDFAPLALLTLSPGGEVLEANLAAAALLGLERSKLLRQKFTRFIPAEAQDTFHRYCHQVLHSETRQTGELTPQERHRRRLTVRLEGIAAEDPITHKTNFRLSLSDITERKEAERRSDLTSALSALFAKKRSASEYLHSAVELIRQWSGAQALGIRLVNEQQEIPYASCVGFEPGFIELENRFSLQRDNCCCIRAITQKAEGPDRALLTPGGSYRCDNARAFAEQFPAQKRERYHGTCVRFGFASVAIVPMHCREGILGAIHLADRRIGQFPLDLVEFIESLTPLIGEAVRHFQAEAELAEHRDHLAELVKQRTSELEGANEQLRGEITQRKAVEEDLRASEELNRRTLQALPAHIAVINRQGRIVAVNQAWAEFARRNGAGGLATVAVGANYCDVCRRAAAEHDPAAAQALAGIEAVLRGMRESFTMEYPCHSPQQQRWFLMTVVPFGPGGEGGAVITHVNITERRRGEARMAALGRLGLLLSAAHEPAVAARALVDTALEFCGWDACFLLVHDPETDTVTNLVNMDTIEDQRTDVPPLLPGRRPTPLIRRVLQEGPQFILRQNAEDTGPITTRFGDTSRASLSLMFVPVRLENKSIGVLSVQSYQRNAYTPQDLEVLQGLADHGAGTLARLQAEAALRHLNENLEAANEQLRKEVASRQVAEQALLRMAEDLKRSNLDLEQFGYVASHDLQEPLRAVAGYVRLLEHRFPEKVDAKTREYIAGAAEGATRMERLITDLLTFSRLSTEGRPFTPVNLDVPLNAALRNLQFSIRAAHATVTHDPLPTLPVDESQIVQLFQNLIGNALKFHSERPPQIHIGARHDEGRWVFRVQDNGIGIDPQYSRAGFPGLPAAAHAQEVSRHRHRAGHLQEDCRAAWRQDLGRVPARPGLDVFASQFPQSRAGSARCPQQALSLR